MRRGLVTACGLAIPNAPTPPSHYGRNRVGGVGWQRNDLAHAMTPAPVITQDNYYWYDGLQQVTAHERGDLDPTSGPPYTGIDPATCQQQESFTFDQTGNWNATATLVPGLSQSRTQDQANQITALTGPSGVVQPAYDPAGNMSATGGLDQELPWLGMPGMA